jgi:inhibitor of KinA sporulation pathway (predicted exonuclease)
MAMIKKLSQHIHHFRHLVFLDFEGTQHSHEMIAFGAVKVDIADDFTVKKTYKGIHRYVLSKEPIGSYVTKLTQITPSMLEEHGVSYKQALVSLKNYVGNKLNQTVFIVFGNHDLRILNQSLVYSKDADEGFVKIITKHSFDFSRFIAEFLKDEKGNPLSLVNNLIAFNHTFKGTQHHPLDDAKNLLALYKLALERPDIIFDRYSLVLKQNHHLPTPIRVVLQKIINNEIVNQQTFMTAIKDYLK